MARSAHQLKDIQVRNAKPGEKVYKLTDGEGLYLFVHPAGGKSFRRDYKSPTSGKRRTVTFGRYPEMSLEKARQKNRELKALLSEGKDPLDHWEQQRLDEERMRLEKELTFGKVVQEWLAHETKRVDYKESTIKKKRELIQRYLEPALGNTLICDIRKKDLADLPMLNSLADQGKLETVKRLSRIIMAVFDYAYENDILEKDPSRVLRKKFRSPKSRHRSAITEAKRFGELLKALQGYETSEFSLYCALQIMPLLFTRNSELCEARWSEVNFDKKLWTIPAERTKMKKEFRVPLSRQASDLFQQLFERNAIAGRALSEQYVFKSARSKTGHIRIESLGVALRRLGFAKEEMTPHGFRSSAATLLHENFPYSTDVIEAALSHGKRVSLGMTYDRSDYLEERTKMMQDWADWLDTLKA